MKYKVIIPAVIISILAIFFSFNYFDTLGKASKNQNEVIQKTVLGIIDQAHFDPKVIDDSFSATVFQKTIEGLDYDKKFLLQSDINQLSKYRLALDEQIRNNDLAFFNELTDIFSKRTQEAEQYYKEALKQKFDFTLSDDIETDPDKIAFSKDVVSIKERWRDLMKYRVLSKYTDLKKEQGKKIKDSADYKAKTNSELLSEAVSTTQKVQERYFKRLSKLTDSDRFSIYMNAITGTFDPHTNFMQPQDRSRFEEMMSGSFYGIGATLQQQDDGRVKVTSIVTGSPCWKQGSLKVDDIIEKVAQGDEAPVDVVGYDLEDIVKMIRGPEGTTVKLTVRKSDGSTLIIPIERGKVELDYIFAKSAVIDENGHKIGYINLPEFYSNFNGISERKSSTDVEQEIQKLMSENVEGIILDLRNNGGGSLSDVVDIVGLFVGTGPVVQIKAAGGRTAVLKSKRSAPLYNGPLAVMINNGSASASEILAAAIQDYRRGIIIGTNSFGKGTVQKIVPLDQFVSASDKRMILENLNKEKGDKADFDGIGSLKLTIQKFYRINGGSTQLKGVHPDIKLPDAFDLIDDIGEGKEKSALPWDKIAKADYKTFYSNNGIDPLIKLSQSRVQNNKNFNLIKRTAERLKYRQDNSIIPLNENQFNTRMQENEALSKELDMLDSLNTGLNVQNLKVDVPKFNVDSASTENNNTWLKKLRKDAYISETANVLNDIINNKVQFSSKQ